MATLLARAASKAAWSAVNGGATTTSTSCTSFTSRRSSLTYFTASATDLYIFQLPTMSGLRIGQRRHAGQHAAAEELQRRAAAGGDVGDLVGHAGLGDRGNGIAAADDRGALHRGHGL